MLSKMALSIGLLKKGENSPRKLIDKLGLSFKLPQARTRMH